MHKCLRGQNVEDKKNKSTMSIKYQVKNGNKKSSDINTIKKPSDLIALQTQGQLKEIAEQMRWRASRN